MKEYIFSVNYHYLPNSSLVVPYKSIRFCSGLIILVTVRLAATVPNH